MRRRFLLVFTVIVWLTGVVLGFGVLQSYKSTPGAVGKTPATIDVAHHPAEQAGQNRLLMFVHPRCPCSTASLAELAVLLEHRKNIHTEVVFVAPDEVPDGWEKASLWQTASALPGVKVRTDRGGVLANRYGAATSGHVVLFGPYGKLLFSGGITPSRGHEGDNAGLQALLDVLGSGELPQQAAPVFGCPLFSPNSPSECCKKEGPSCPPQSPK